eukprot:6199716-Pleurochrysis_carterae.AAC.4
MMNTTNSAVTSALGAGAVGASGKHQLQTAAGAQAHCATTARIVKKRNALCNWREKTANMLVWVEHWASCTPMSSLKSGSQRLQMDSGLHASSSTAFKGRARKHAKVAFTQESSMHFPSSGKVREAVFPLADANFSCWREETRHFFFRGEGMHSGILRGSTHLCDCSVVARVDLACLSQTAASAGSVHRFQQPPCYSASKA